MDSFIKKLTVVVVLFLAVQVILTQEPDGTINITPQSGYAEVQPLTVYSNIRSGSDERRARFFLDPSGTIAMAALIKTVLGGYILKSQALTKVNRLEVTAKKRKDYTSQTAMGMEAWTLA